MQVLSVRCGMTKNLGNYESAKLELEAAPSEGQTTAQLLAEVNEYLTSQLTGMPVSEKQAKPAKKAEPKPDPTTAASGAAPPAECSTEKPAAEKPKAKGKGSKKAQTQASVAVKAESTEDPVALAHKRFKHAMESETIEELLERFNELCTMRDMIGEKWEATYEAAEGRYRKINTLSYADPEVDDQLCKAFKRERQWVAERKSIAA